MAELNESIMDWAKFDASSSISKRLNGVTKAHLESEVKLWDQHIALLEPLDSVGVKSEVASWIIEIPNVNQLTFDNIAMTYSRLVNYKVRMAYLLSTARDWRETCESAIKYIEDLAPAAFDGTGIEKKANASHVVQPFVHLKNEASRLENYLIQMHSAILFCAQQLDLLIKERQSRAKLNLKLSHEGEEILASNGNEIIEEDGDTFQLVQSNNKKPIRSW